MTATCDMTLRLMPRAALSFAGSAVVAIGLNLAAPTSAHAQQAADAPHAGTLAGSVYKLSFGGISAPKFSGSDQTQLAVLPGAEFEHPSGLFASTKRGLGFAGGFESIKYAAAVGLRGPRYDSDRRGRVARGGDALRGMGDIDSSVTSNLSLIYSLAQWVNVRAGIERPLTHRGNGTSYITGIDAKLPSGANDTLALSMEAMLGDRRYMQTYYGVTEAQSAAAGFAVYRPRGGMATVTTAFVWERRVSRHWSVLGTGGAITLVNQAARSPLARRKASPLVSIESVYTF